MVKKWPHIVWRDLHWGQYLDELLHLEGRGDYCKDTVYPDCVAHSKNNSSNLGEPTFHCCDCFLDDLVCKSCCV